MDETGHSGFTLLELLITLALTALLAGLALPAAGRMLDNTRLRTATEALVQELRQARQHALSYQQPTYFSLSASAGRWCFGWRESAPCDCTPASTATTQCRNRHDDPQRSHLRRSTDFPGILLQSNSRHAPRPIRFSPLRGTASAGSFSLHNPQAQVRVIISPLGRVRTCSVRGQLFPPC